MIWFYYFWGKILFFILGVAHGDPIFAKRFYQIFFRTSRFQLKLLKSIESLNIFHWKPAKKINMGVVLGQNLGQIRPNVVEKDHKQTLSISFFHILHGEYLLK